MTLPLFCVDSFTSRPFTGNPAGVVILGQEAPETWMRNVAGEMNLSETAFVVKQGKGEYGLRWFTPTTEVNMCGHATLAAAYVLWEEELEAAETITFQTKRGALTAKRVGEEIALDFPVIDVATPCWRGKAPSPGRRGWGVFSFSWICMANSGIELES